MLKQEWCLTTSELGSNPANWVCSHGISEKSNRGQHHWKNAASNTAVVLHPGSFLLSECFSQMPRRHRVLSVTTLSEVDRPQCWNTWSRIITTTSILALLSFSRLTIIAASVPCLPHLLPAPPCSAFHHLPRQLLPFLAPFHSVQRSYRRH
ncbi:hypothetical protein MPH_03201 [Macrophomina phaseolina MS6]|uniref:Uncharacterized protein n=1 Tax=Macrophomina phaseolina (strain MS6) TaxID=1126212 RepID=K2RX40_MACPH|nr:hypothetical protein MPH_03201 [Macrophomina phaseolina MS6]